MNEGGGERGREGRREEEREGGRKEKRERWREGGVGEEEHPNSKLQTKRTRDSKVHLP